MHQLRLGNLRFGKTRRILRPRFWQEHPEIDQRSVGRATQQREHDDLTLLQFAAPPTILSVQANDEEALEYLSTIDKPPRHRMHADRVILRAGQ
jgi:hypothetical protein